jgi:hypothetical protein
LLNPFLHCLFRVSSIEAAVIDSDSPLAAVFRSMADGQFPVAHNIDVPFAYDSPAEFASRFIPDFLPGAIPRDFRFTFADGQSGICLSSRDVDLIAQGQLRIDDSPAYLLMEPGNAVFDPYELGKVGYSLLGVVCDRVAFVARDLPDRWLRFADVEVSEVPYEDALDGDDRPALLFYVRSQEAKTESAERIPTSCIRPGEIPVSVVFPGAVARTIVLADFSVWGAEKRLIGVTPGTTFADLYEKISVWAQTFSRGFGLWTATAKLPRSDDVIGQPPPPLLVQFRYPHQTDGDLFVYVAGYAFLVRHSPLELWFTLEVPSGASVRMVMDAASFYLACELPVFELYVATDRRSVDQISDLGATFESCGITCGSIMIVAPAPPYPEMLLPRFKIEGVERDYLTWPIAGRDESLASHLAQRVESRLIRLLHKGADRGTVIFPRSLQFGHFSHFVKQVLELISVLDKIDTLLFFPLHATVPILAAPGAAVGEILDGVGTIDVVYFPRIAAACLADKVRLEVVAPSGRAFIEIFPAGMTVAEVLDRAQKRRWIDDAGSCVLVMGGRVLGAETTLRELENPMRIGIVVGRGERVVVVRSRNGEVRVVAAETVGDVRRWLGEEAPVRLAAGGVEVGDEDVVDPGKPHEVLE